MYIPLDIAFKFFTGCLLNDVIVHENGQLNNALYHNLDGIWNSLYTWYYVHESMFICKSHRIDQLCKWISQFCIYVT